MPAKPGLGAYARRSQEAKNVPESCFRMRKLISLPRRMVDSAFKLQVAHEPKSSGPDFPISALAASSIRVGLGDEMEMIRGRNLLRKPIVDQDSTAACAMVMTIAVVVVLLVVVVVITNTMTMMG